MQYVRNILSSWIVWLHVAATAMFWGIAPQFDRTSVMTVVEAAVFPAAVWVCVTFGIRTVGIIWRGEEPDSSDVLMTGISTFWVTNAGLRLWDSVWRIEGSPSWMVNHYFVSFLLSGYIISAMLSVGAGGSIRGNIPRRAWIIAGGLAALGAALGLLIVWLEAHRNWFGG